MRRLIVALSVTWTATAAADDGKIWMDPDRGCGRGATFMKSGKIEDLPGCSGKLPKDAPHVEVVLHDAKRALLDAEEDLARGRTEKLDQVLDDTRATLSHPQAMNPEMPDRWD